VESKTRGFFSGWERPETRRQQRRNPLELLGFGFMDGNELLATLTGTLSVEPSEADVSE